MKYNFADEALRSEVYNHICLMVDIDEITINSLRKGGKKARTALRKAIQKAMADLIVRNHEMFSRAEEPEEEIRGITASLMESTWTRYLKKKPAISCFYSHREFAERGFSKGMFGAVSKR